MFLKALSDVQLSLDNHNTITKIKQVSGPDPISSYTTSYLNAFTLLEDERRVQRRDIHRSSLSIPSLNL